MLVVLEGIDGSGKGTQARMLYQRCLAEGVTCFKLAFPQYGKNPFADTVKEYLNGQFGDARELHPKLPALLFAGDRFASRELLLENMRSTSVVICDRYVGSNLAHQAAKLPEEDRDEFIVWLSSIEYRVFGLPEADLTIYLDMPVKAARRLIRKKHPRDQHTLFQDLEQGAYTSLSFDIHERDPLYLSTCRQVYEYLLNRNIGGQWCAVKCLEENEQLRTPADISQEIWRVVKEHLLCDVKTPETKHAQM